MTVTSFKELMKKAMKPDRYILTKDDVDYLDRPANEFLKKAGIITLLKKDKISNETLISAYEHIAIVFKANSKKLADFRPESYKAYLRFFAKIEMTLKLRGLPDYKINSIFKDSKYRRFY